MPKSLPRSSAIACCSVSRSLPLTRTTSPWMLACTFSLLSLMSLTMSFAFSVGDALLQRDLLPHAAAEAGVIVAVLQALQRHVALHQLLAQDLGHGLSLYSSELASRILWSFSFSSMVDLLSFKS